MSLLSYAFLFPVVGLAAFVMAIAFASNTNNYVTTYCNENPSASPCVSMSAGDFSAALIASTLVAGVG